METFVTTAISQAPQVMFLFSPKEGPGLSNYVVPFIYSTVPCHSVQVHVLAQIQNLTTVFPVVSTAFHYTVLEKYKWKYCYAIIR